MRKSVWMSQLERALSREGMTGAEKRTVMNFYEEMYQDKHDDGLSEEEIIKEFGFPEDVAQNVRENEERRDLGEEQQKKSTNDTDFEAEGYEIHPAKLYRPAPEYDPRQYAAAPPAPPANNGNGRQKSGGYGVVQTVFLILLDIVLFALGLGLSVGGVAVIISSFVIISFNAGAWLFVFGIGLIIFACGCLIFGSAIKLTKSLSTSNGGTK